MWHSLLSPLEEPRWKHHLEQYGGQFYPVPGKPSLSFCYVELRFDYGPQTVIKPALFIRNERWSAHVSRIKVHETKNGSLPNPFPMLLATSDMNIINGNVITYKHTEGDTGFTWINWVQVDTGEAIVQIPVSDTPIAAIKVNQNRICDY